MEQAQESVRLDVLTSDHRWWTFNGTEDELLAEMFNIVPGYVTLRMPNVGNFKVFADQIVGYKVDDRIDKT